MVYLKCLLIALCLKGIYGGKKEEDELNKFLQLVNDYIAQEEWDQFEWSTKRSYPILYQLDMISSVGNFSTLKISGNQVSINKADYTDRTVYSFDVPLGFSELLFFSRQHLEFLLAFEFSAKTIIHLYDESIRLRGTITRLRRGNCEASVDHAEIQSFGWFDIKFRTEHDSDIMPVLLGTVADIIMNNLVPHIHPYIQSFFDRLVKPILSSKETSDFICKYFQPL